VTGKYAVLTRATASPWPCNRGQPWVTAQGFAVLPPGRSPEEVRTASGSRGRKQAGSAAGPTVPCTHTWQHMPCVNREPQILARDKLHVEPNCLPAAVTLRHGHAGSRHGVQQKLQIQSPRPAPPGGCRKASHGVADPVPGPHKRLRQCRLKKRRQIKRSSSPLAYAAATRIGRPMLGMGSRFCCPSEPDRIFSDVVLTQHRASGACRSVHTFIAP